MKPKDFGNMRMLMVSFFLIACFLLSISAEASWRVVNLVGEVEYRDSLRGSWSQLTKESYVSDGAIFWLFPQSSVTLEMADAKIKKVQLNTSGLHQIEEALVRSTLKKDYLIKAFPEVPKDYEPYNPLNIPALLFEEAFRRYIPQLTIQYEIEDVSDFLIPPSQKDDLIDATGESLLPIEVLYPQKDQSFLTTKFPYPFFVKWRAPDSAKPGLLYRVYVWKDKELRGPPAIVTQEVKASLPIHHQGSFRLLIQSEDYRYSSKVLSFEIFDATSFGEVKSEGESFFHTLYPDRDLEFWGQSEADVVFSFVEKTTDLTPAVRLLCVATNRRSPQCDPMNSGSGSQFSLSKKIRISDVWEWWIERKTDGKTVRSPKRWVRIHKEPMPSLERIAKSNYPLRVFVD